jgi:hypothetical protein
MKKRRANYNWAGGGGGVFGRTLKLSNTHYLFSCYYRINSFNTHYLYILLWHIYLVLKYNHLKNRTS